MYGFVIIDFKIKIFDCDCWNVHLNYKKPQIIIVGIGTYKWKSCFNYKFVFKSVWVVYKCLSDKSVIQYKGFNLKQINKNV